MHLCTNTASVLFCTTSASDPSTCTPLKGVWVASAGVQLGVTFCPVAPHRDPGLSVNSWTLSRRTGPRRGQETVSGRKSTTVLLPPPPPQEHSRWSPQARVHCECLGVSQTSRRNRGRRKVVFAEACVLRGSWCFTFTHPVVVVLKWDGMSGAHRRQYGPFYYSELITAAQRTEVNTFNELWRRTEKVCLLLFMFLLVWICLVGNEEHRCKVSLISALKGEEQVATYMSVHLEAAGVCMAWWWLCECSTQA